MRPEDVPAEWVEKARHAVRPTRREDEVRWMLAAVLPEIQAQALADFAVSIDPGPESFPDMPDAARSERSWVAHLAHTRAGRLTAMTEGPTT